MSSKSDPGKFFIGILVSVTVALGWWHKGALDAHAQSDWERIVQGAKAEGKLVAGIPASAELRKGIEEVFKARFPGIELELATGRGPANANRIMAEHKAGVQRMSLLISGTATPFGLLDAGILEPVESFMALPEVKERQNWWGGHMYIDTAGRYIYTFQGYQTENIWHNTTLVKPGEIRHYDDLLNPQWKDKIGYLDPRTPGSGQATWAFLWKTKGQEYLTKLATQGLFLSRDQRQLADSLAKGRLALTIGITYYTFAPHFKAGLPVKSLPWPKEEQYTSNGSGALSIIKNPPQPNATKLFVNWILSKEGQEIFGKAMGQGTRRVDVDTSWLPSVGVKASKDFLTLEEHLRFENFTEKTVRETWDPAAEFAKQILK